MSDSESAQLSEHISICELEKATYDDRVYNDDQHNFCTVDEKGFDAVLFVALGIIVTCLAPRKHYAIVMLIFGALLQILNIEVNLKELSNALSLWIGITPAKSFFYIFLPPLLLDSAVRIDFFVFKKVMWQVFVFAFGVVAINTVLLAVFMLYVMNLRNEGWEWTDAFLFACMIASTDALAVTAIMKDGSGPESLIILAEGESLFNDATSIVFFDLFWPRFKDSIKGTLKDESVPVVVGNMALDVLWLASGGALIGLAGGFVTQILFKQLQSRSGHTPVGEVGISVGIAYLVYYVAESFVEVSGVIAVVVYGLYGAATTKWDISPSALESKVFSSFWDVTQLLTNGIVFFYAGASATNFFWRCEEDLFDGPDEDAWKTIFAWLPGVYVGIFLLRFVEIGLVSPLVGYFGFKLKLNEIVFISLAGLRGALALILAQELLQYEFPRIEGEDFKDERKVRAQSSLWVCGFVLLTLMINAPGIPFLLKICGLEQVSPIQLKYRKKSEEALNEFTKSTMDEMKADRLTMLRGVNWKAVLDFIQNEQLHQGKAAAPKKRQVMDTVSEGMVDLRWRLVDTLSSPLIPVSTGAEEAKASIEESFQPQTEGDAPFEGSHEDSGAVLGLQEEGMVTQPIVSAGAGSAPGTPTSRQEKTNGVALVYTSADSIKFIEQYTELPLLIKQLMERSPYHPDESSQKYFVSTKSFCNLAKKTTDSSSDWKDPKRTSREQIRTGVSVKASKSFNNANALTGSSLTTGLIEADLSESEDDHIRARRMLAEARFRMLMGLKKYFQNRRISGFLSAQGMRLLQWACDLSMEETEQRLQVWDYIEQDFKARLLIRAAYRLRYLIRRLQVWVKGWPRVVSWMFMPPLNWISYGLSALLVKDLQLGVEAAVEYWIGLNAYKAHSSWLMNVESAQTIGVEVEEQAKLVWSFITDREIEAPERFEAIQTFRAKRAIVYAQVEFVDDLFDAGLLEESEHEHLKHDLDVKRAQLAQRGPIRNNIDVLEFLQGMPFFANATPEVFARLIRDCQLCQYKAGEFIQAGGEGLVEAFSFHVVVNGILKTSYTDRFGKLHDFHVGRGGVLGLLSALSGQNYEWAGRAYAQVNAVGSGPSLLTVPRSMLKMIHTYASGGHFLYQQIELDLFRLAAMYITEFMSEELLELCTAFHLQKEVDAVEEEKRRQSMSKDEPVVGFLKELSGDVVSANEMMKLVESDGGQEAVRISFDLALEQLDFLKNGLLEGLLVLVPPNSRFLQSTPTVLVIGSLNPVGETAMLCAPFLMPIEVAEGGAPAEYRSGADGAILVSCPENGGEFRASSSAIDDGMRIGANMQKMPVSATRMQNELFR